jgi:hypothetical protein
MIERTERRFDMKPRRLIADTAYGIDRFLGWLVEKRIIPHIPVWNMSERKDGTFSHLQALEAERVALAEKCRIAESETVKLAVHPAALRKWHADLEFLSAMLQEGEAPIEVRAALRNLLHSILIRPVPKDEAAKDRTARASGGTGRRVAVSTATPAGGDRRPVRSSVPAKGRPAEIQPFFVV